MFIRGVEKKNKNSDKSYSYYRLTHSYRVGKKTRQQVLLNLGKLDNFPLEKHKLLADRIEELLMGTQNLFFEADAEVESLAQVFVKKIIKLGVFSTTPVSNASSVLPSDRKIGYTPSKEEYTEVNLESAEEIESRNLGGEWFCKQLFSRLDIDGILGAIGMKESQINVAKAVLTAKMLHPSSELEAERWLDENSSYLELYQQTQSITRYKMYNASALMYESKNKIEEVLYEKCQSFFAQRNTTVIFDLTNLHFEGLMAGSDRARFGRSKKKRSDCRLISLALTIDSNGFVRSCRFWDGNVSEPKTLQTMLEDIESQVSLLNEKPLIVFDAGIMTEENLLMVKGKFDYICVSRTPPKNYKIVSDEAVELKDNKGNKIMVEKVESGTGDTLLRVNSEQKALKEKAMDQSATGRFEERLTYLKEGLDKPRRLKTTTAIHEHIGKLKRQFSKIAQTYEITYVEDKERGVILDLIWTRKIEKIKNSGQYFLRYSKQNLSEAEIWDGYNLTREVEASFKCLKTDLNIRPVYHQKDNFIETHIWLGVIAYQMVNYSRVMLKEHNINYSWTTIVNKLQTQRLTTTTLNVKDNKKAYLKTCTKANDSLVKIYDAMHFKTRPFVRKVKVVTQL